MDLDDEIVMPVMAPISIRSDIPELRGQVDSRVLVCVDLTWKEYLEMFNVQLNPEEYIVKGTGGREFSIDNKIGDYISSFKRKMKIHPVGIEKIKKPKMSSIPVSVPVPSVPYAVGIAGQKRGSKKRSKREAKIQNLIASKRKIYNTSPDILETIQALAPKKAIIKTAFNVNGPEVDKDDSTEESKVSPATTGIEFQSSAPLPISINPITVAVEVMSQSDQIECESFQLDHQSKPDVDPEAVGAQTNSSGELIASKIPALILERINSLTPSQFQNNVCQTSESEVQGNGVLHENVEVDEASFILPAIPKPASRGRKTQQRCHPSFVPGGIMGGRLDIESSDDESIVARNPHCYISTSQPSLKSPLMHFLCNKVSNRDMLKVREELMKLKDHEDYFKLTALTPLAAGLLEQMLCRSLPRPT